MIDAPTCSHRYAVSAISSGVTGTCGESFFRGTEPVGATVMTSFSIVLPKANRPPLGKRCGRELGPPSILASRALEAGIVRPHEPNIPSGFGRREGMLPPEVVAKVRRFYTYQAASSFAIWIPFWTLWIRGNLGSDFGFTLVDVAFWLGMLASQLPVGVLADRIGRRRTIVLSETIRSAGILGYGLGVT